MQLVSDKIRLYDPMKNKVLGEKEVFEKFGVKPDHVIDVQSLIRRFIGQCAWSTWGSAQNCCY